MKQCFGYVRVSSQKQGEGVSLEAQKDAIKRFAVSNDIIISQWFDEQQTAAKSGRPVFSAMHKALKAGKAAGVVMHKIDRSARNFFDWAKIGELADSGIDVHFATESLDFRSRGGRLTANIQMAVAEDYIRNLRSEVLKGQRGQLERGFYPFAAPIGYRNNGKRQLKTIDPVKGPLVKQAFELYSGGQYSLHSLRHEMARRGLAKASGAPFSKGCVEKFLANPFYTGIIRIKRTGDVYEGAHEPLISVVLFESVAAVRSGKSGKKVTRHNHLFRGLFGCGHCRRSMIPEKQKGHIYYRCQYQACPSNCIREEPLDEAIIKALKTTSFTSDTIAAIDQRAHEWVRNNAGGPNQKTIVMQLAKADERLEKLEDAAIEQIIDKATFEKRKERLLLEKVALEQAERENARFHQNPAAIRKFLERLKNVAEHYRLAEPAEKREIVSIATSNRRVKAKNVHVEPANWLVKTRNAIGVFSCADARTTSRTPIHVSRTPSDNSSVNDLSDNGADKHAMNQLFEIAGSPEVTRLFKLFMNGYQKASNSKINRQYSKMVS